MSKTLTMVLIVVTLTACSMSNEEIIENHKACEDAGMHGHDLVSIWHGGTVKVVCRPNYDGYPHD